MPKPQPDNRQPAYKQYSKFFGTCIGCNHKYRPNDITYWVPNDGTYCEYCGDIALVDWKVVDRT